MSKRKNTSAGKSRKPQSRPTKLKINKYKSDIDNHKAAPVTIFNYANELHKQGDDVNALKFYQAGLRRNPSNIAALINISMILITMHRYSRAIFYLTRAIFHNPDQFMAYIFRSVAYLGLGKKAEAYQDFKTVYLNYPDKTCLFRTLNRSKYPQIDFDQAMEYCRYPDGIVRPVGRHFFPTEDCPQDDICLYKEFCVQQEVCPQNDPAVLEDIILRKKLGHPRDGIAKERPGILHRKGIFLMLWQYLITIKNRVVIISCPLLLSDILLLNDLLME